MAARLFVIDGSPAVRRMVEQVSATEGYEVHAFSDGPSALRAAKTLAPRTVIADFHLDKITFSSFCKELGKLDSLAETSIVSLVDSSDKVDEKTYRSMGVAVFLTKPLEPGNLIETLRELSAKQAKKGGTSKTKRTWPPVTTSTDLEDEEMPDVGDAGETVLDDRTDLPQAHTTAPSPATPAPPQTSPSSPRAQEAPAQLETASKTLIDAMAAGIIPQVTQIIHASLPGLIGKEVEQQISARLADTVRQQMTQALSPSVLAETVDPIVRREVSEFVSKQLIAQLASMESSILPRLEEQIKPLVQRAAEDIVAGQVGGLVEQALPNVVRGQMGTIDRLVVNTVQDLAAPQVKEAVEQVVRESVDAQLPKAIREQIGSIDRLVVNTIQDLAGTQVREKVDQLVQDTVRDRIAEAVRDIVPALAEAKVTEEIKRLSALD